MKKILGILQRNLIFVAMFVMLAIAAAGFYLVRKMQQDITSVEAGIRTKYEEMKRYENARDQAPSPQLIERLTMQKAQVDAAFNTLMTRFSTTYPSIPEFKVFPNVEYKEFLLDTEEYLDRKARKNNITLPSTLPFQEKGFPKPEEIPVLSLQLTVLKNLLSLLIDAGVGLVNNVAPGIPSTVAFYKVLPIDLSITGSSIEVVRFLKYLNNPSSFFTLESFAITKSGPDLFRADLKINAVMLKKEGTS